MGKVEIFYPCGHIFTGHPFCPFCDEKECDVPIIIEIQDEKHGEERL